MNWRILITLALAALLLPISGDAQVFNFPIDTIQEVPTPTIPAGVPIPIGTGMVTLDTDANMINWTINYQDLTGSIVAPGAHLHGPARPGATAGVQIFLSDGVPSEPATGQLLGSAAVTDDQEQEILDGLWYVNIHTEMNQPGEIRGQVVPEPATGCLAVLLTGICWLCLRRARSSV